MNSQLTDKYKKEVSDILKGISAGLAETVIENIETKLEKLDGIIAAQKENYSKIESEMKHSLSESQKRSDIVLKKSEEIITNQEQNSKDLVSQLKSKIEESIEKIKSDNSENRVSINKALIELQSNNEKLFEKVIINSNRKYNLLLLFNIIVIIILILIYYSVVSH